MKTTIATITAAVLMTISLSSFAKPISNPKDVKATKNILLHHAEAISIGSKDLNKYILAKDFEYVNSSNNISVKKKEYMKFLKENEGLVYNCTTTHELINQVGNTALAKTTFTFEDFTRVDHITMKQTKDGWKITSISTSYEN